MEAPAPKPAPAPAPKPAPKVEAPVATPAPAPKAEEKAPEATTWTIERGVNLRPAPGMDNTPKGILKAGTQLEGVKLDSGWVKTEEGYFWHTFGTTSEVEAVESGTYTIHHGVNVRPAQGMNNTPLGMYLKGATVKGEKMPSGWVKTDRGYFWHTFGTLTN